MQIEPLTGVWVVVRSDGTVATYTVHLGKKESIGLFCSAGEWKDYEQAGYKCIQVDIEFKPTK